MLFNKKVDVIVDEENIIKEDSVMEGEKKNNKNDLRKAVAYITIGTVLGVVGSFVKEVIKAKRLADSGKEIYEELYDEFENDDEDDMVTSEN